MDPIQHDIARGEEAQRIINSAVFAESFEAVRAALVNAWVDLPTSETQAAQDAHRRIKCLQDVRKVLENYVTSGRMAQKKLSTLERASKAVKSVATNIRNR